MPTSPTVALASWAVYHRLGPSEAEGVAADDGRRLSVPVVEGVVATRDVSIYLDGLGTVQDAVL